jgi:hypothetical protein
LHKYFFDASDGNTDDLSLLSVWGSVYCLVNKLLTYTFQKPNDLFPAARLVRQAFYIESYINFGIRNDVNTSVSGNPIGHFLLLQRVTLVTVSN